MGHRGRLFSLTVLLVTAPIVPAEVMQVTWLVNNLTNIGGLPAARTGDPQVITTPYGAAVWFNGVTDGLKLATNPIAGLTNFTVEMIFRPEPSTHASSRSPRIFHIQSPDPPDHRLTLEARLLPDAWYGDTFLRADATNNLTLADTNRVHPLDRWYQLTVTYDGAEFRQWVNTTLELAGSLTVPPLTNGVCSIGMRANTNSFFEGAIRALRFTGRVLDTNEFLCVPRAVLRTTGFADGRFHLDLHLHDGLPLGFSLQQSSTARGPWIDGVGTLQSTDPLATSYRLAVPVDGQAAFFRVRFR